MPKKIKAVSEKSEEKKELNNKSLSYYFAVGRRKEAVARVKLLISGDKSIKVNGRDIAEYFPGKLSKVIWEAPLKAVNALNRFTIEIKVEGSGLNGQLGAVVHGFARALDKVDPENNHTVLRRLGFLTRDPRAKERRKIGTGGKARRQKQSPKR